SSSHLPPFVVEFCRPVVAVAQACRSGLRGEPACLFLMVYLLVKGLNPDTVGRAADNMQRAPRETQPISTSLARPLIRLTAGTTMAVQLSAADHHSRVRTRRPIVSWQHERYRVPVLRGAIRGPPDAGRPR